MTVQLDAPIGTKISKDRAPTTSPRSTAAGLSKTQRVWHELSKRIGAHRFDMWFGHTKLHLNGNTLEVRTDSQFVANWIDGHFMDELRSVTDAMLGEQVQIHVRVEAAAAPASPPPANDRQPLTSSNGPGAEIPPLRPAVPPHHRKPKTEFRRLDDFVVGPSNRLAYAAACRLAQENDSRCISPLFIHGDCGLGKTHLLQGICHRYIQLTGRAAHVRYVTGEQFTNEYISAIRNNTIDAFRNKIRKLDLLAIDDVHFLSNKARTQAEFLYTLDAIDLSGARVVMASDNHPHHIKRFSQSLVSRFLSGMVVKVDKPDRATRIELIDRLAAARGMKINPAAIEMIASNCVGSVRELEGAITKLAAYKSLLNGDGHHLNGHHGNGTSNGNGEIGVVLAEQLFREQAWQPVQTVRMASVIDVVCDRLGVTKADVLGSGRHRRVVLARSLVAYLGREMTTHSFPEIAESLGRANHSTIHTADQRLRKQIADNEVADLTGETNMSLKELVDQLRRAVLERK